MWNVVIMALLLDRIAGDPIHFPHPVIYIGRCIAWFERKYNHPELDSPFKQKLKGICLLFFSIVLFCGGCWLFIELVHLWSPIFAWVISMLMIWTTIAWKGLVQAGQLVYDELKIDGLDAGRKAVSKIVGRDTETLSEAEVVRAAIESLVENIVDAIVSPILYACIGGAPLALLYRVVNTLDSMVGYKNERFRYFGWASARMDDVLNYLPARITALFMWIVFHCLRLKANRAWAVMKRDAHHHLSPNSGIPEAMLAGALGVQLGGYSEYQGNPSYRATMGDPTRQLTVEDILCTIRVVHGVCWLTTLILSLSGIFFWIVFHTCSI